MGMDSSKKDNPATSVPSAGNALEDYAQLLEEAKSIQGISLWKDAWKRLRRKRVWFFFLPLVIFLALKVLFLPVARGRFFFYP